MKLKIVKNHPDAVMPRRAHREDAGADLHAVVKGEVVLPPGARALISTELRMEIPPGYEVQIRPRSGLALKQGVTVLNAPGTIDASYRGAVGVILINHGPDDATIRSGDRIAQMVIARLGDLEIEEVSELGETERSEGGFGPTGS